MDDLMMVITVVSSVLCIILFFKIWSMTNKVDSIEALLNKKRDFVWEIRKAIILAPKDPLKANEILIEAYIQEVSMEKFQQNAIIKPISERYIKAFEAADLECPDLIKSSLSQNNLDYIFKNTTVK